MNYESKRQELASRLVQREVYYSVSSLISTLSDLVQNQGYEQSRHSGISWEDDILPILESYNWDEAGDNAIKEADLEQLEFMVDYVGYWSDALVQIGYDSYNEDSQSLDEWLDTLGGDVREKTLLDLRAYVSTNVSDWEEFCREFDVDMDDWRSEVYEHWIVSSWAARRLKDAGYVTGEVCGLTIWGRCTTGQAICLDHFWQQLAIEVYDTEWKEFCDAQPAKEET